VLVPIGGNAILPNCATLDTFPRDVLTWHDNNADRWAAIGTDDKLYVYSFKTQTLTDITPAGLGSLNPVAPPASGYGNGNYGAGLYGADNTTTIDIGESDIGALLGNKWSMDTFGQILLVVPTQDGSLYQWDPSNQTATATLVPNAPIGNAGVIVTDQRSVVLYGSGDPRNVAWSDQESLTVWTPDITNLAGSKWLQTQSYAMTAVKVSQGILIYTANDVHLMQYVGPPYAYGIIQVGAGCGPMSLRAVAQSGSFAMWAGQRSFWMWNGTVEPINCDVKDWFYSFINPTWIGKIFASPNPTFSELWWDWPDANNTECNRYVGYNFSDRTWFIGQRMRTASDPTGTMDHPIVGGAAAAGSTVGALYLHEYGWLDNGAARASAGAVYAESGNIVMGEGDLRYNCTQVVYDAGRPGMGVTAVTPPVGWQFFCREQPFNAAGETATPLYSAVQPNGLLDVRLSGRSVRMRMVALNDGPFALGRNRLVVKPAGQR
jgi:hypothetical protein